METDIPCSILMEISGWYIRHRLAALYIGGRHGHWINCNIARYAIGFISNPFKETGIIECSDFGGGLLAVFVVFIVLFMAGVNQWLCIGFIVSASLLLVWQTFRLNARYGTHGLMKAAARKRHPRFIISRKAIPRLFNYKRRKEERT